jgi:hypothetical protein
VTPLMIATAGGNAKLVRMLLKCHADRALKDASGRSALDYAPSRKMFRILRAGAAGARENDGTRQFPGSARSSARRSMPSHGEGILSTQL